jgi:ABC-type nitrate/sulfonate/bicarbonate transport system permease component
MNGVGRLVALRLGYLLAAGAAAIVLWIVLLAVFDVSTLIGIRPWTVWSYLVTDPGASAVRRELLGYLGETARDFGAGYLVGLAIAFVLAVSFSLSSTLENVFMPTAMVLRSMPIIVITPLITLLFGLTVIGVTAIVTLTVFLPVLANVLAGLRAAQAQHGDLVLALGGNRLHLLFKVALPGSLPALLAGARLAVPLSVTGAMVGEWLATGTGLGGYISRSTNNFGYDGMWAAAVLATAFTMLVYTAVSIVDTLVHRRFGSLSD